MEIAIGKEINSLKTSASPNLKELLLHFLMVPFHGTHNSYPKNILTII